MVNEDGTLGWSPVYAFPHYERAGTYDYVVVTTDSGAEVCILSVHINDDSFTGARHRHVAVPALDATY